MIEPKYFNSRMNSTKPSPSTASRLMYSVLIRSASCAKHGLCFWRCRLGCEFEANWRELGWGLKLTLHNKALGAALIDKAGRTFRRLSRELGPRDFDLKRRNVLFAKQLSKVACRLVHRAGTPRLSLLACRQVQAGRGSLNQFILK